MISLLTNNYTTMDRNQFLESDGLFWESETHEWFHDKTSTDYARKNSILWGVANRMML